MTALNSPNQLLSKFTALANRDQRDSDCSLLPKNSTFEYLQFVLGRSEQQMAVRYLLRNAILFDQDQPEWPDARIQRGSDQEVDADFVTCLLELGIAFDFMVELLTREGEEKNDQIALITLGTFLKSFTRLLNDMGTTLDEVMSTALFAAQNPAGSC
jgi:hypothetical protein